MKVARGNFGPVASLFKFSTEEAVFEMANNTEFGLASYFYSKDVSKIFRVPEALEYGMVGINTGLISTEVALRRNQAIRTGPRFKYGLDDYVEIKYLCLEIRAGRTCKGALDVNPEVKTDGEKMATSQGQPGHKAG